MKSQLASKLPQSSLGLLMFSLTISSTISHLSWWIITGKLAIWPDSEFNVGEVADKILCKTLVFNNALITL
ncbi:MAG: hypothetical protein PUB26_00430 [Mycoplasmataceae bacterium]|nr:hypothetical protein [Mycoplasmataceae bacterium]